MLTRNFLSIAKNPAAVTGPADSSLFSKGFSTNLVFDGNFEYIFLIKSTSIITHHFVKYELCNLSEILFPVWLQNLIISN